MGWGPDRIGRAWDELMRRLGYQRYVSQGGDSGSVISDVMARQAPPGLTGVHVNMPATVPPEIAKALQAAATSFGSALRVAVVERELAGGECSYFACISGQGSRGRGYWCIE